MSTTAAATSTAADDRRRALQAFDDTKAGVKGLVDAGVTTVPAIFHHPPDSLPLDAPPQPHHERRFTIPVIDLAGLGTPSGRASVVGAVKTAAETVGFFQVVNHGVPEAAMSEMLAAVRRFNEEPSEARAPYYSRDHGRRVRYTSNFDLFQSPAANWRDSVYIDMTPDPPAPEEIPPTLRSVVPEYERLARQLYRELLELLSEALGLRRGHLKKDAGCLDGLNLAAHYYPACPEPHLTMGTTRHSDPSFLTVLLQDAVGGLQVLVEDDGGSSEWVEVPAVPGALVVNIGDYLQLVSNDRFKSVEHRVVANGVGPRVSVACFFRTHGAAASTRVLQPIVAGGDRARYKSATVEELLRHYRAKGLDGTSALDHFRLRTER
ncbi:1-aminocyclopropane-1-carboxylate oxidase homolog 1-like [Triticum dicoccoides]|uniref:1-aminocyclopropane-1-carboxylate oxidase homolog 1-like n=1 Tax=Triticum dicoccoides TaxID=85692 RepID=UPI00188F2156|nr:1-aminocyclopropane-1-carboxylate oxidase homolog 1-like [Triticum dicoccoides]